MPAVTTKGARLGRLVVMANRRRWIRAAEDALKSPHIASCVRVIVEQALAQVKADYGRRITRKMAALVQTFVASCCVCGAPAHHVVGLAGYCDAHSQHGVAQRRRAERVLDRTKGRAIETSAAHASAAVKNYAKGWRSKNGTRYRGRPR